MRIPTLNVRNTWKSVIFVGAGVSVVVIGYLAYRKYKKRNIVEDIVLEDQESLDLRTSLARARKEELKRLLQAENVHIRDMDYVEEIIDSLIEGGPGELQVIADFDRTLAAVTHGGEAVPSCHNVLENAPGLPSWFREKSYQMRDYYFEIEINPNLTRDEKFPFMVEWWNKAHDLLVSCSIRKEQVKEAVQVTNLYLREGSKQMIELLHQQEIPFLIFSAGVGDIIEECLKQRYVLYENIKIVANWMDFNHAGALVGFKGENIHIFNKNVHAIEHSSYFDDIRERHNVILLGDMLADLDIAEGVTVKKNMLTIGFLNNHVVESLEEYKSKFDIVLVEEPSVVLVKSLVENIVAT